MLYTTNLFKKVLKSMALYFISNVFYFHTFILNPFMKFQIPVK